MKVINDNETKDEDNDQDNQSETYYGEYQYQKSFKGLGLNWTSGVMNEIVTAKADLFQGEKPLVVVVGDPNISSQFSASLKHVEGPDLQPTQLVSL